MQDVETTPLPFKSASNGWAWSLEDRSDRVELKPRVNLVRLALTFGGGIPLWLGGYWFITRVVGPNDDDWMPLIWLAALPAMLLFAAVMFYVDYRTGPRFVMDRTRMTISLPRLDRTYRLSDVLGWQLVEYVRELGSDRDYMSQVILVVSTPSGVERILLAAGIERPIARRFEQLLADIERTTGMRRLG
jgi:hypothetical protein